MNTNVKENIGSYIVEGAIAVVVPAAIKGFCELYKYISNKRAKHSDYATKKDKESSASYRVNTNSNIEVNSIKEDDKGKKNIHVAEKPASKAEARISVDLSAIDEQDIKNRDTIKTCIYDACGYYSKYCEKLEEDEELRGGMAQLARFATEACFKAQCYFAGKESICDKKNKEEFYKKSQTAHNFDVITMVQRANMNYVINNTGGENHYEPDEADVDENSKKEIGRRIKYIIQDAVEQMGCRAYV